MNRGLVSSCTVALAAMLADGVRTSGVKVSGRVKDVAEIDETKNGLTKVDVVVVKPDPKNGVARPATSSGVRGEYEFELSESGEITIECSKRGWFVFNPYVANDRISLSVGKDGMTDFDITMMEDSKLDAADEGNSFAIAVATAIAQPRRPTEGPGLPSLQGEWIRLSAIGMPAEKKRAIARALVKTVKITEEQRMRLRSEVEVLGAYLDGPDVVAIESRLKKRLYDESNKLQFRLERERPAMVTLMNAETDFEHAPRSLVIDIMSGLLGRARRSRAREFGAMVKSAQALIRDVTPPDASLTKFETESLRSVSR